MSMFQLQLFLEFRLLCSFCGPLLCLEVKYYHRDMTQNRALLFHQLKKKINSNNNTCKNVWIHFPPQANLNTIEKNGREAQAPLGTQPEGVSGLSGTCSVSQSDCLYYHLVEHEVSSRRRRPNAWPVCSLTDGDSNLDSWAQRNME